MSQSPATADQIAWFERTFDRLAENIGQALLGKDHVVRLALTCLVSEGHLLLEDYPGTGKTSLARALANTVHGSHSRIQFTPDLLPSDVTGVSIFDPKEQKFEFHPGPIFANVVLADEINRASPKTQSSLLEVMEEGRVTVDGESHPVAMPFMVVATQNPIEQAGTYRLPEAQLDRFLMKTSVGYPNAESTVALLSGTAERDRARSVPALISTEVLQQMSGIARTVFVDAELLRYIVTLAEATRTHPNVRLGISVRGCLAYTHCVKTWAASKGRNYVTPDDVKDLAVPVMEHRILLDADAQFAGASIDAVIAEVFQAVPPPTMGEVFVDVRDQTVFANN